LVVKNITSLIQGIKRHTFISFVLSSQRENTHVMWYISAAEIGRTSTLLYNSLFYQLELRLTCLQHAKLIPAETTSQDLSFFKAYSAYCIADQTSKHVVSMIIAQLMGIGFVTSILANVASFKCYHILPYTIYWLAPAVATVAACLICFLLPFAIKAFHQSESILESRWNGFVSRHDHSTPTINYKIVLRKFRAAKPVVFSCGKFFSLRKGFELTFGDWILVKTVEVMCLPIFP